MAWGAYAPSPPRGPLLCCSVSRVVVGAPAGHFLDILMRGKQSAGRRLRRAGARMLPGTNLRRGLIYWKKTCKLAAMEAKHENAPRRSWAAFHMRNPR
jgi:hypothetical protein